MSNQDFDFSAVPDPANIISMSQRAAVGNVATSVDDNPDDAAQALKISGATGAPASVVYGDLDHHEAQLKARLSSAIVSANPLLQSYVNSHPMAAKVSNDDYGQLDAISQVLRKVAPGQGYDGSILQAAVKGFKENYDYENTEQEFGRYKDWLAQNPLFGNFAVRQAAQAGGAALMLTNQLASGAVGGAAAGLGQLYRNLGGSEAWSDRLTRDLIVAAQVGMAEPMATPEGMLHPEVRKAIDEAHQFANAVGPYLHAEQVPPVGVHPLIDEVHVEQAKMDAKNLADALKESVKSSTRDRSPEMFGNFVKGITDGDIGIAPDAIRKLYGDKPPAIGDGVLGDVVPDLDAKLQAAEATGSDVKVPLADWLSKVEPEVAKELQDHIRARPEGLTLEESKELPQPIEAYHGSPYEFEAFDLGKIGTGEGAQSYGHGLYFAEAPEVADQYAKKLSSPTGGAGAMTSAGMKLSDFKEPQRYKVHIHANKEDFLDWDKDLSEQPGILAKITPELREELEDMLDEGGQSADLDVHGGRHLYQLLEKKWEDSQAASEHLQKLGIPGIKYLDQGSRKARALPDVNAKGEELPPEKAPTSNFVLFDPKLVEITHRNGDAVRSLRQAAKLEPAQVKPLEEGQPTTKAKQLELPEAGTTRIEDREAFAKASAIGMTVDQYKRYQDLIEKRHGEDVEAANARAVEYQRKKQGAEWKANRTELRPQVRQDLLARPEFELDQMLREGKVKLARDGITPEQAAALPKSYLAKDGIHPDDLAGLFGDSSGSDTVGRLVNLHAARGDMQPGEFFKSLVDAETDRQMELRYGNLDKSILEEAKDQVLSETQEQLLHEETLARAAEAGLEYSIGKEELKGAIKDFFDRQLVRDVSSDSALADAGRAGRAAEMALLKGDAAEAFRQKQRQYNAVVMANYARRFEKEQGRFDKLAKRFSARSLDAVDQEYTNWVHDILMRVGKPVKRSVQDLADAVDRGEQKTLTDFVDFKELHDMREVPVAEFLQDPGFRKDYASLTTAEAQAVHDSVKALAKNGRDEQKIIKAGEEYDLNQTKAEMINQLKEFKEKHYDAAGGRWLGPLPPSVARPLRTYMVSHLQLESIFNRWDRGDPRGVFTQFIARELATAANSEAALEREFAGKLREVADKGDLKARVPNDLFKDPLGGEPIAMTRKNLRAILLNVGNKSNFDKLARGYIGSIGKGEEGKAQVAAFQGDIMMWLHQHATKEDWDWAQGIGDTFAGIKSKSDVMYRSLTGGVEPENIRLSPIQTPHGEYPGWYYPVIYHPVWEGASKKLMGGDPLEQNNYIRATTPAGYTKQRTGYAAPLALDLDMMPVRMRQMLHDIAFRPSVIQAGKIFYDKDVRSAITKHYGTEYTKMLVPYLKDVANSANYRNDAQQVFSRFSEVIRQNIIATLVGLNPGTVLKHGPTAAVNSVTEVGLSNFLKAAKGLFSINDATGETNWGFAMKTSEELQRRHRFYRETLGGAADELGDTSSLRDTMIKLGSYPVAMSDLLSAVPTWMAKYESEMADHGVHGDAVFEADRAVRRAHGSSVITNRPQVMRTGAMGSWLASLYGFFNHIMNRQYELAWRAGDTLDLVKQGEYSNAMSQVPKLSGMLFSYVIFPAIVEELVTPMQDKKGESWGLKAAKSLGYTVSASWIGIRDLVSAAVSGRDPSIGLLSTAYKTVTDTIRDLNKDRPMSKRNAGALLQHSATTLGAATGWTNASEGRAGRFLLDYANGQEHPKGPWGWMTGLRYGTLKNHSPTFQRYLEGR